MPVALVGVNHKTAPVEIREKLSFSENSLKEFLGKLLGYSSVESGVILSTCNRTEIYVSLEEPTKNQEGILEITQFLAEKSGLDKATIEEHLYFYVGYEAVSHLFKVVSGLDSMVLGETQILGQVKKAYQYSLEYKAANKVIHVLFQQALTVGKRVRSETGIDQNSVSISYVAVELAKQILGTLEDKTVLILGAGKMSELTALHLVENGVNGVIVSNRSYERALALANRFQGKAVKFNQLKEYMPKSDIIISCTSASHFVIKEKDMEDLLETISNKKIVLIDLAVPRDIDPKVGLLPGITLYDVDDLTNVIDAHLAKRLLASTKAEEIINEELNEFKIWWSTQFIVPTITAFRQWGEEIKKNELKKAFNSLGNLSEHDQKIISSLANSIVNKMMHVPVTRLKESALNKDGILYSQILQDLFPLDEYFY